MSSKDYPQSVNPTEFNPFVGAEIVSIIPATESQLEIWLSCALGGDDANRGFNESISLHFNGKFDVKSFEEALLAVVYRHEALHSAFNSDGTQMLVFKEVAFDYKFEDLSQKSNSDVASLLEQYTLEDALHVFDLVNGPLFKFRLYKLNEDEHYFIFNAHHIICDGWSLGIILRDLSKLYSAFKKHLLPDLEAPDLFSVYAHEQKEFVNGTIYRNNIDYWVNQHKQINPNLNLPIDYPRPTNRTFKSKRIDSKLEETIALSIKKIGIKEGCSLVNTLLAVFEIFIAKISGQKNIVIGLPAADQSASGRLNLVGHCVNLLPLKSNINEALSFIEYLKERKLAILDAYDHQQFTFGSLLKNLKISRDPARVPLVPVVFNVDMEMDNGVNFDQLTFKTISNKKEFRNFEFSLNVWGSEKNIQLEWSYNSQLFKPEKVEEMIQTFNQLLKRIVSDPNQKLEKLLNSFNEFIGNAYNPEAHYEISKKYWLYKYSDKIPVLELPIRRATSLENKFESSLVQFKISESLLLSFKEKLDHYSISLEEGYVCLCNLLLYKYSGEKDFITGIKLFSSESLIALRNFIQPNDSFLSLFQSSANNLREGLKHGDFTVADIETELNRRQIEYGPQLYSIKIEVQGTDHKIKSVNSGLDLIFRFLGSKNSTVLELEYNQTLFDKSVIEKMGYHFQGLMEALLNSPDQPLNYLEYINVEERNHILESFNNNLVGFAEDTTIVELFESQVLKTPKNLAVVYKDIKLDYTGLNEHSNQLGAYLRETYEIQPDDLIGIQLERSEWQVISILAVLKSGGAYVPIDPEYPLERIAYLKENSKCKVVIDEKELLKFEVLADNYSKNNLLKINTPNDLAYVIYTSGSTGQPKGVMVENRNIINYNSWFISEFQIANNEGTLLLSSFTFDGVNTSLFGSILSGSALYVIPNELVKSPKELAYYISNNNVTFIKITPSHLNLILSDEESFNIFCSASRLRLLIVGGDKIIGNDISKIKERTNKIEIVNHYGPTETTVGTIANKVEKDEEVIPIGKPISNTQTYILDEFYQIQPIGIPGELYIGGKGVARGYLYNEELTKEKFVKNPFRKNERVYKTGDLGYWLADGRIVFIGRKDFQLKIRGYRVEAGEIEKAILQFKGILNVLVTSKGEAENEQSLVAYLVGDEMIDTNLLRAFLSSKLPSYMVPSQYEQLDLIPLLPSGKIDRSKIELKTQPIQSDHLNLSSTKEEMLVAKIWSDLLPIENIDKSANFFELGGHSLIAIKVVIRIENETGIRLPMSSLFEYSSIEKLANLLKKEDKTRKWKCLVPIKTSGNKVPLYIVHGGGLGVIVFHHISKYLDEDQPVYGLQALGIDGIDEPLDSIEKMANYYISEMLLQNPDGPYALAGHSSGGLIAFEMAKQLKNMGKDVKTLSIFDFNIDEAKRSHTLSEKLNRQFSQFITILWFSLKSIYRSPLKTFEYYGLLWKLRFISLKSKFGIHIKSELSETFINIDKAIELNSIAIKKYKLEPYDGLINLFVSIDKVYYQEDPIHLGWKPYAAKGIVRHIVNGDHDEMIMPPNNIEFAQILQKVLNEIQ